MARLASAVRAWRVHMHIDSRHVSTRCVDGHVVRQQHGRHGLVRRGPELGGEACVKKNKARVASTTP